MNNSSDFDLDLFFKTDFLFLHVATAGLQVNDEIFFNSSHNDFRNLLKNISLTPFQYKLNPFLQEIISSKRETNTNFNFEFYIADFIKYAQLGLFSFDRTFINNNEDNNFHLVAYPILDDSYNMLINHIYGINLNLDYNQINNIVTGFIHDNLNRSFKWSL